MEKISSIIAIVAIICFISGGFAFIINDSSIEDVNTNAISKTNDIMVDNENNLINLDNNLLENKEVINDIIESKISETQSNSFDIDNFSKFLETCELYQLNSHVVLSKKINYTDRYGMCVDCGGLIPLGEITKPLPDCYNYTDGSHFVDFGYMDDFNSYSYEYLMKNIDYHIKNTSNNVNSEPPSSTDNIETPNNSDNKNPSDFKENNWTVSISYPTGMPSDVNFG